MEEGPLFLDFTTILRTTLKSPIRDERRSTANEKQARTPVT